MKSRYFALPIICATAFGLAACNRDVTPIAGAGDTGKSTMPSGKDMPKDVPNMATKPPGTVGQAVDDSAITVKVKSALAAEKEVKSTAISVETQQGRVKLTGSVANPAQVDRAVQVAQRVTGVKEVVNELSVN